MNDEDGDALTPEDLRAACDLVQNSARICAVLRLRELIACCDRAEAIGWVLDPTLYRAAHRNLGTMTRILRAGEKFASEVSAALKEHSDT